MSSPDISGIINDSLYSDKALFVLSASIREGRSLVQDLLIKTWQRAQSKSTTPHVRDLSIVRLSFPWSEHPAHALFTSITELRDIAEWETIVGNVLRDGQRHDVATNTHIASVLDCMAYPGRLGTREFINKFSVGEHGNITTPLFRAYLLDMAPQASDRSKLGHLPHRIATNCCAVSGTASRG